MIKKLITKPQFNFCSFEWENVKGTKVNRQQRKGLFTLEKYNYLNKGGPAELLRKGKAGGELNPEFFKGYYETEIPITEEIFCSFVKKKEFLQKAYILNWQDTFYNVEISVLRMLKPINLLMDITNPIYINGRGYIQSKYSTIYHKGGLKFEKVFSEFYKMEILERWKKQFKEIEERELKKYIPIKELISIENIELTENNMVKI